jgi:anthranilate phosphoribosyltransferase
VIPSLRQPGKVFRYQDFGPESPVDINPTELGIEQAARAVPLPERVSKNTTNDEVACISDTSSAAAAAAEAGLAAIQGTPGPAYDSLVYACALILWHTGREASLVSAAERVRAILDSGKARQRLEN